MEIIDLSKYNYLNAIELDADDELSKLKDRKLVFIRHRILGDVAEVIFRDEYDKNVTVIYKNIDIDDLKEDIKEGEDIDISFSYIHTEENEDGIFYDESITVLQNFTAFGCCFNGSIYFNDIEFSGEIVSFEESMFFCNSIEYTKLWFDEVKFSCKEINFCSAIFYNCDLSFTECKFDNIKIVGQKTNFFDSVLNFKDNQFNQGVIDFKKSKVMGSGGIEFEHNDIKNVELDFDRVISPTVYFESITFQTKASLRFKEVKHLTIKDSIINTIVMLDGKSKFESISFNETINNGKIYIDWNDNNVNSAIDKRVPYKVENIYKYRAEQYRLLKSNFNSIGYYEDEDMALVQYIDNYLLSKGDRFSKLKKYLGHYIGGYGTNPISIIKCAFLVVCLFSIMYFIGGLDNSSIENIYHLFVNIESTNSFFKGYLIIPSIADSIIRFGNCLYFRGITFLTIGYGDILPQGFLLKFLTVLEGGLGVLLMSYLSVAIVRKILR